MFEQFANSIKATLYDRISSPLSSSFLISWCIWNYKILIVLLSSMEPYQKYSEIDIFISTRIIQTPFYEPIGYFFSNGFLFPLLSATAYIFIYPIPSKYIYEYHIKQLHKLKKSKNTIEELDVLSVEDSQRIKKAALSQEKEYLEIIQSKEDNIVVKDDEIKILKDFLKKEEDKNQDLINRVTSLNESITKNTDEMEKIKTELSISLKSNEQAKKELSELKTQLENFGKLKNNPIKEDAKKPLASVTSRHFTSELEAEVFKCIVDLMKDKSVNSLNKKEIYNALKPSNLSNIAINHALDTLESSSTVRISANDFVFLTGKGNDIAVALKLA